MTEELNILDIPDEEIIQTKSQKQLEYDTLERETKLDKTHIWSFYEMELDINQKQRPSSSLPSIILKYVMQYCMLVTQKLTNVENKKFSIMLQADRVVYAVQGNKHVAYPVGQQFSVVGLRIPSLFLKSNVNYMLVHYDHISDADISLSGRFGLVDNLTSAYTQMRDSFTHPGLPHIATDIVYFTSTEQSLKVLNILIDYIEFIERYYNIVYPILRYDLIPPKIIGSSYLAWKIINGRLVQESTKQTMLKTKSSVNSINTDVEDTNVTGTNAKANKANTDGNKAKANTPPNTNGVFVDFSTDLLNTLNNVQKGNFGVSYYYDIMYMLDANKLTKLYNLGSLIGIDNKLFKAELNKLKTGLNYDNDYLKQVNLGYKQQLEIIKRKNIAYTKFQIKDLTKLTEKQNKIINLELKKFDETSDTTAKMWKDLRNGMLEMTPDNLKNTIKQVEKTFTRTELSDYNLLAGGVCPHIYKLAVKTLESFGRTVDLRDYLISEFALPSDESGYFCKVCGEQIAYADTTAAMRFSGERNQFIEDDPLQLVIWKEAMYIISTNVRFITPMPVKPLVNSLATGLRNQIASESAKVQRSKTTTRDIIKDSINLYASIYIYAALCALMLANPGKLIFAREQSKTTVNKYVNASDSPEKASDTSDTNVDETSVGNSPEKTSDVSEKANDNTEKAGDQSDTIPFKSVKPNNKSTKYAIAAGESPFYKSSSKRVKRTKRAKNTKDTPYIYGGKTVTDAKTAEKIYLTTALKLIFLTKEPVISRLKNMSPDLIKQIFIKNAYSWAVKYVKPITFDEETDRQTKDNPILLDSFYRYVYLAKRLNGVKADYNDVAKLLGREEKAIYKDLKEDITQYATVKPGDAWETPNKKLTEYSYKSYLEMLDYYQNSVYKKSFVPVHAQVIEYRDKYANLLKIESELKIEAQRHTIRPLLDVKIAQDLVKKYNRFDQHLLDLAQHYCPDGAQHKIGSYIYSAGGAGGSGAGAKNTIELTKKDIAQWIDTNNVAELEKFNKMHIVNERCMLCKGLVRDLQSSAKADKTFAAMFKKLDDVLAFYQYYENRCPVGNLHDLQQGICVVCKFHTDYTKSLDRGYYEKYVNAFHKIQAEKQSISVKSLNLIAKESRNTYVVEHKDVAYQYTLKNIAEWSQLLSVKYNLLVNVGLYEGEKFDLLESSQINPSQTKEASYTRAMRIKGHILKILREYNMILNYDNIVDLPLRLKELVAEQKKIVSNSFVEALPKFNDFLKLDAQYYTVLTVVNYNNFLLEYLANIMIQLSKLKDKYYAFGKAMAKYFTDDIIATEKFVCKPLPYFAKMDVAIEDNTTSESDVSEGAWANRPDISGSDSEFHEEKETETYENNLDNEGFDVEDADAVWENE